MTYKFNRVITENEWEEHYKDVQFSDVLSLIVDTTPLDFLLLDNDIFRRQDVYFFFNRVNYKYYTYSSSSRELLSLDLNLETRNNIFKNLTPHEKNDLYIVRLKHSNPYISYYDYCFCKFHKKETDKYNGL